MPGRQQIPSFQIASGTTNERDNSYNIPTGSIFFNTDTSNIELSGNVVVTEGLTLPRPPKLTNHIFFYAYCVSATYSQEGDPINFSGTLYNTNSCFTTQNNNTSHYFTAPINGYYRFSLNGRVEFADERHISIEINTGSSWEIYKFYQNHRIELSSGFDTSTTTTWIQQLNQDHKIRVVNSPNYSNYWKHDDFRFIGEFAFSE